MPSRERAQIAIVEDDAIMGESLLQRLTLEGYDARWWQTGTAAVEGLRQRRADLVVCDIRLPDMNGEEVFRSGLARSHRQPGPVHHRLWQHRSGRAPHPRRRRRLSDQAVSDGRIPRAHRPSAASARAGRAGGGARSRRVDRDALGRGHAPPRCRYRQHFAPHGRERRRQGGGGPLCCTRFRGAPQRRSWRSTAPPSPPIFWRASCSATSAAPSPAPTAATKATPSGRATACCSSTKSPSCRRPCRPSSCGSSRSARFSGSAANGPCRSARASSARPTPIFLRACATAGSAKISISAST